MIPVDEALALVLDNIDPLPAETIDFAEACGRLLREDVASDIDMPPFPRSAVDGFALRAEDLAVLPARLSVVGEVPAREASRLSRWRPGGCANHDGRTRTRRSGRRPDGGTIEMGRL